MMSRHDFDISWDYDDPAASASRFRVFLDSDRAADDLAYGLELQTQLARACGLQGNVEEAHAILDRVEQALGDAPPIASVRYALERGRVHHSAGRREAAIPLFERAWSVARDHDLDGYAVDAAHMLAIASDGTEAERWHETALQLADTSPDPAARRWRASLHNNIGWLRHAAGDCATALRHFEQALHHRLHPAPGWPPTDAEIRIARWCVGRCLRSLGRVDEALAIQQALWAQRSAGDEDPYLHEELAACLAALGQGDDARPHAAAALRTFTTDRQYAWLVEGEPGRITDLRRWSARSEGASGAGTTGGRSEAD